MTRYQLVVPVALISFFFSISLLTGCATRQGYQGTGIGALTGSTAGILLDPDNRWRGAVIGGGLGALLGGGLTDRPRYSSPYYDPASYRSRQAYPQNYGRQRYYPQGYAQPGGYYPSPSRYPEPNRTAQGAVIGGLTGATAGALLDDDNGWRGGLIGGFLGSLFGGSIGAINSGPSIPVLRP